MTEGRTVGFIGSGRAARIIANGWQRAGKMPLRVVLYDPERKMCDELKSLVPACEVAMSVDEAAKQDVVFLAVHPPVIKDAVEAIRGHLKDSAIAVSLAPKFTIATLADMYAGFWRIARLIPNAPSSVGRGFNPIVFGDALDASDKETLKQMLQPLGDCPEVNEADLEAYAILTAMGPTYFWPQLYQLKSLAESFGLSEDAAMEALDKMLWGTVATMKDSGLAPDQVQDLIPVKPMADEVQALCEAYEQKLTGLMQKIKP